jgi:gliding motility-associated-like protein
MTKESRKYSLMLLLQLISAFCMSQTSGAWAWMKGSKVEAVRKAVYGTKGVPSPANTPPPTYEGLSWTDLQGNFWLYNGNMVDNSVVWKFDPLINQWTWMSGDTLGFNYKQGVVGVPSATATPGDRHYGAPCWTDLQGNFWLFGALNGNDNMQCDLWKYDPVTLQWTWVRNDTQIYGTFGTKGVPDPKNNPPGVMECKATWVDNDGNLWMYGGIGHNNYEYAVMWKYDIKANMWTWMAGGTDNFSQPIYGTKGVPHPGCTPGSRWSYARWKDVAGNLWMFGGYSHAKEARYNDMWKYDIVTNQWAWMGGTKNSNDKGHVTFTCVASKEDYPASRLESTSCWTDACGNFWMYGGYDDIRYPADVFSDFWVYDYTADKWTTIHGSTNFNLNKYQKPVYGTQGVLDIANYPGARAGACTWIDKSNKVWLFGGMYDMKLTNDLWKFVPDADCPGQKDNVTISASPAASVCKGDSIVLSAHGAASYIWQPGNIAGSSIKVSPSSTTVYSVSGVAVCGRGTDSIVVTVQDSIEVKVSPVNPVICPGTSVTLKASGADTYTWTPASWLSSTSDSVVVATPPWATLYTVVGKKGACKSSKTVTVATSLNLSIDVTPAELTLCSGDSAIIIAHGAMTYSWQPPFGLNKTTGDTVTAAPLTTTFYTVTGKWNNCSGSKQMKVRVSDVDTLSLLSSFCDGDSVATVYAPKGIAGPFQWLIDNLIVTGATADSINIDPRFIHQLKLQWVLNGCTRTSTKIERTSAVLTFGPTTNTFTPNGDGVNDVFFPYIHSTQNADQLNYYLKDYTLQIFNRWGDLIFMSDNPNVGWLGKGINGETATEGVYYWLTSFHTRCNESEKYTNKGVVQLLK